MRVRVVADSSASVPDEYLARLGIGEALATVNFGGESCFAKAETCEVHARFTGDQIRGLRRQHPGVYVLAHPECPPEVLAEADFVGSTAGMIRAVDEAGRARVVMITECSMSDNVAAAHPEVDFVRPCNLCPHMKRISLPKIQRSLEQLRHEVEVAPGVAARARRAVERMLEVGRGGARS